MPPSGTTHLFGYVADLEAVRRPIVCRVGYCTSGKAIRSSMAASPRRLMVIRWTRAEAEPHAAGMAAAAWDGRAGDGCVEPPQ